MKKALAPLYLCIPLSAAVSSLAPAISLDLSTQKYLEEIAKKCTKAYFPPSDSRNVFTCTGAVDFELRLDGKASHVKVVKCPNYRNTTNSYIPSKKALEFAITSSSPFPNPPKTLHCPNKIRVNFDSNGKATVVLRSNYHADSDPKEDQAK